MMRTRGSEATTESTRLSTSFARRRSVDTVAAQISALCHVS